MIVYEQKNGQINKKSADVPKHKIIKKIKAIAIACSILFQFLEVLRIGKFKRTC